MNPQVLEYIQTQRIGVLSVQMLDGCPHAATIHFAHSSEPLMLFFATHKTSLKGQTLSTLGKTKASVVIGVDEGNMKTLQMDGEIRKLVESEKSIFDQVYLGKFPEKAKMASDLLLVFIPTWWRFTDWTTPQGKVILTSED